MVQTINLFRILHGTAAITGLETAGLELLNHAHTTAHSNSENVIVVRDTPALGRPTSDTGNPDGLWGPTGRFRAGEHETVWGIIIKDFPHWRDRITSRP